MLHAQEKSALSTPNRCQAGWVSEDLSDFFRPARISLEVNGQRTKVAKTSTDLQIGMEVIADV
jgi:hypothetical protein